MSYEGSLLEDLDPDGAFLDLVRGSVQRLLHHIFEERDGPFAGAKDLIANQQVELRTNHAPRSGPALFRTRLRASIIALSSDSDFSTR